MWHGHATWAEVAWLARAMWHGRATSAVVRPALNRVFLFFGGEIVLARVFLVASCFFVSIQL